MKDDYQTAKASAEKLRDDLLEMAKRALAPDHPKDVMKPDDLNALCNGKLFLESGFRDVTRIVDQSNLGKLGHEAIQQIIRGAFLIGACATYTDSQKAFVGRPTRSFAGKKSGEKRQKMVAETWHPIALSLAKEFRGRHPGATRQRVADYISNKWNSKNIKCPESRLYGAVCKWTKNGVLAAPGRRKAANS
ncbi:MAG: hypothetical protein ABSD11_18985 [Methylocella sp.]|jgi:hypothetical protein